MKLEVTTQQHRLMKQLAGAAEGIAKNKIKPAARPAMLSPLILHGWVAEQKQGRGKTLSLTESGREYVARHPDWEAPRPQFSVSQRLLLMELMLRGGMAVTADFSAAPAAKDRKPLIAAKLLEESKGAARSIHLALTDTGWKWAEDHLADSYSAPGKPSAPAARVLQQALTRLQRYLAAGELRLADFVRAAVAPRGDQASNGQHASATQRRDGTAPPGQRTDIESAIAESCLALGEGADRRRLRLAQVRALLPEFDRAAQDRALMDLAKAGSLVLYGMDDPKEISADDRAAEFRTPGGEPRHLVYWIGGRVRV